MEKYLDQPPLHSLSGSRRKEGRWGGEGEEGRRGGGGGGEEEEKRETNPYSLHVYSHLQCNSSTQKGYCT